MKRLATSLASSLLLGVLGLAASTAPAAKTTTAAKPAASAAIKCPVCKTMVMTTKKTQVNTRMVKVNGKTMYCCDDCKMKTNVTIKAPERKAVTRMKCPVCKTMVMTSKKTQVNTRMVKVNGKTMYCCDDCKMKTKM
jgi:phage FluMu protein Com